MRILSVHNRYQIRGGEDECREAEEDLLRERGHQVDTYEEDNARVSDLGLLRVALRTTWSNQSHKAVRQRTNTQCYDVMHVQNFFPLISPSVYYAAAANGVPVVQTLHNYRLLCPNALFFRDGQVCEDCLDKLVPWPGVVHGCYRDSVTATATVAAMLVTHRALSTWEKKVDLYTTPSEFARRKFIRGGIPADKIVVKPNFVSPDPGIGEEGGKYALFVGRLSAEKGLGTLLAAWDKLQSRLALKIVGDGPLDSALREKTSGLSNVQWLGRQPLDQVYQLMGAAKFLIIPSEWYETFGRIVIEAFAKGTPVIAANIGAIAELVDHGRTGLLFNPGDSSDLTSQVDWALCHPEQLALMRDEARAEFETRYTAERNYRRLIEIYARARSCLGRGESRSYERS